MGEIVKKAAEEGIELAEDLQRMTLHGPLPIESTMKLATAVIKLKKENKKLIKENRQLKDIEILIKHIRAIMNIKILDAASIANDLMDLVKIGYSKSLTQLQKENKELNRLIQLIQTEYNSSKGRLRDRLIPAMNEINNK